MLDFFLFQEEAQALGEILAKRHKRGKFVDEKPIEEKTVLHSKFLCITSYAYVSWKTLFVLKDFYFNLKFLVFVVFKFILWGKKVKKCQKWENGGKG